MADFFYMGGYALYVWSSFGVTAVFLIGELIMLSRRRQTTLRRVARINRMKQEETTS